eukprot:9968322-Lingulodinium_polyedra.AAC.1
MHSRATHDAATSAGPQAVALRGLRHMGAAWVQDTEEAQGDRPCVPGRRNPGQDRGLRPAVLLRMGAVLQGPPDRAHPAGPGAAGRAGHVPRHDVSVPLEIRSQRVAGHVSSRRKNAIGAHGKVAQDSRLAGPGGGEGRPAVGSRRFRRGTAVELRMEDGSSG